MSDFLTTLKFILKQSLSLKHVFHKMKENKKTRNMSIIMGIVLLMCLPSYAVFIGLFTTLFETLQQMNLPSLFLVMAIFLSTFLIIFFGVFQIMGFFYFSNDVKIMTPLPLKPSHYLVSKFIVIYIWELIISLFAILPFFIIYGIYEGLSIINWLTMLINFTLIPIVPLVIVGIITVLLMKFSNFFRNRDAVRMLGYTLLLVGLLGFQYYFYQTLFQMPDDPSKQAEFIQNIIQNASYFLDQFANYYPITLFVKYGVIGNVFQALLSVIGLLAISILFIYLFSLILQWLFLDTYLKEHNGNNVKRRKLKITNKTFRSRAVSLSFTKIDFLTLLRVPMYFLNTFALVILLPVIFIIFGTLGTQGLKDSDFDKIIYLYTDNREVFWLMIALFLGTFSALIPIASTTFSREGKTNWIMRTLPISAKDHILGRFYTAFFTQLVFGVVVIFTAIFIISSQELYLDILYGLLSLVLGLISASFLILVCIFIDLKRPLLEWENPQKPVKQNLNVLISFGVSIIYGTIMYLLFSFLSSYFEIKLIILILGIINLLLVYISYHILHRQIEQSLVVME